MKRRAILEFELSHCHCQISRLPTPVNLKINSRIVNEKKFMSSGLQSFE
jgi:hypothetical protein